MKKEAKREGIVMEEGEFLERLECLAAMAIMYDGKDIMPFIILEDLIKLRRTAIEAEEVAT